MTRSITTPQRERLTTQPLSSTPAGGLRQAGFIILPGPISSAELPQLAAAYDSAMSSGTPPDLKVGSTTTRLNDFAHHCPAFHQLYDHPPLLEACSLLLGAPPQRSSTLARTLHPHSAAQNLHTDIPRNSPGLPLAGFIFMLDDFRPDNGATRFVPGSHLWPLAPEATMQDRQTTHPDEVLACGPAGSLIVFDASIWHGHTANQTPTPRRSIQGYFLRRGGRS